MSRLVFSVLILIFLSGCAFGGWDISNVRSGIFKAPQDESAEVQERVNWEDYSDSIVQILPFEYHGCMLLYLKHELSCGECDSMDETFKDPEVVSLLNDGDFIAIKATDDMKDWEKAIARTNTKIIPSIHIMTMGTSLELIFSHEGTAILPRAARLGGFIGILKEASKKCRLQ